jgi:hypothetical protein
VIENVRVREPIVEGLFYPDDPEELKSKIAQILDGAAGKFSIQPGASAIITPHAGYEYCGAFLGSAFLAAAGRRVKTVVILAPVHREPDDAIYLTESKYFSTPFGNIEVADEINSELETSSTRIYRNDIPHLEEHAIEVQLPFIQHQFPEARIVPMLLGRATLTNVRILAKALDITFVEHDPSTLLIVSSNLSSHTDRGAATKSVRQLTHYIEQGDCEGLLSAYHKKDISF